MARTTQLGLRVLQGEERRELQRHIAIERAIFERDFAGRKLAPFDREQIFASAVRRLDDRYISITDEFVRETQRRLPWATRIVAEAE